MNTDLCRSGAGGVGLWGVEGLTCVVVDLVCRGRHLCTLPLPLHDAHLFPGHAPQRNRRNARTGLGLELEKCGGSVLSIHGKPNEDAICDNSLGVFLYLFELVVVKGDLGRS